MIYLKQYLFQHKGKVLLTVLLLLGQVVGTLLIPALLAELVDQGILAGNISVIWNTGVKMLAVTVLATAAAVGAAGRPAISARRSAGKCGSRWSRKVSRWRFSNLTRSASRR
ncbi:hypothetical protein [Holdemania filiformis]|uniref:hypothetical protein n=1 Tax=Holdemania filiformis TaxID=61171 RepID=UPI002670A40E|nr:hypothetical protein [Holdemania filiformis]